MKLKVLGSSSSSNGYLLENDREALMIESSVRFAEVKMAFGFNIGKFAACLGLHFHSDHAKHIKDVIAARISVLVPAEVFSAAGIDPQTSFSRALDPRKVYEAGNFRVPLFELQHDVRCFGYMIHYPEMGTILFVTDTGCISYEFAGINNMLIEANYCEEIVYQFIYDNRLNAMHKDSVEHSLMSIQSCLRFLSETDLLGVNNIVLIYLSNYNRNDQSFLFQSTADHRKNGLYRLQRA